MDDIITPSKKQRTALETLVEHVRRDISYGEGGTFVSEKDENEVDKKAVARVEEALGIIIATFNL